MVCPPPIRQSLSQGTDSVKLDTPDGQCKRQELMNQQSQEAVAGP